MHRFIVLLCMSFLVYAYGAAAQTAQLTVDVYKSPTCGCCGKWIERLRAVGFQVRTTDVPDVSRIKDSRGVPRTVRSCHTAFVGGYVVEGHVPASDVRRLLRERPKVVGIGVNGMPAGSPGMEVPGVPADPYDVVAFDARGKTTVFASYRR
jgi:hypothetical protein